MPALTKDTILPKLLTFAHRTGYVIFRQNWKLYNEIVVWSLEYMQLVF